MIHRVRRRLSRADDGPLFAVAARTDRSRIPCQTQVTRYCFCLTATGSFDIVSTARLKQPVAEIRKNTRRGGGGNPPLAFCSFVPIVIDRVSLPSVIFSFTVSRILASMFPNCESIHAKFDIHNKFSRRVVFRIWVFIFFSSFQGTVCFYFFLFY